jgi:hypothetical protein
MPGTEPHALKMSPMDMISGNQAASGLPPLADYSPGTCPNNRDLRTIPLGAGTRNLEPAYNFPANRIAHQLIAETLVRT